MDRKRSIFFAYEWSTLFINFYKKLINLYKKDWDVLYGPNSTTQPEIKGKIEKFKNKNKQLFDLFVKNIQKSSIFIADVTTNNPNVLLELGIAIKLNKNILVVSGAGSDKLPFNIRGIEIEYYKSSSDLSRIIRNYIAMFKKIKNMPFSKKRTGINFSIKKGIINASDKSISSGTDDQAGKVFRIVHLPIPLNKIKDINLKVKYRILEKHRNDDWFGFMFRSAEEKGAFEPIHHGSVLINARWNGITEITIYPGQIISKKGITHDQHDGINFRSLEILFDNEYVKISGDKSSYEFDSLTNTSFGYLYIVCFRTKVEYKDLEIINTDTTSEII